MNTLSIGDMAPDFILPDDKGETVCLNDLRGNIVVLYFYPKDDTPGCTKESRDFSDKYTSFKKYNAVVLGVSRDTIEKHEDFKNKYQLPFQLISDEDSISATAYGVLVEKNMFGKKYMGIERSTFLIGRDGRIKKIWRKVSVAGHIAEVLDAVKLEKLSTTADKN
jgi:thioredoxin-dependent peroxiredoxin